MPDYIRIGPPYGQINELYRPAGWSSAAASADALRYGVMGWWAPDRWQPVPSGINPGSAIASWSINTAQTLDASSFWNDVLQQKRSWSIYNATSMPSGAVIARATVMLPYAATGMFVFELAAGATFAPFPVVPYIASPGYATDLVGGLLKTTLATVIGSVAPISGSSGVFEVSRAFQHAPPANSIVIQGDDALFTQGRFVAIEIKTAAAVASGAQLTIAYMRLAALPVGWVGTHAGDLATAALLQASSLVGTYYGYEIRGDFIGQWGNSRQARSPAHPIVDALQPVGQTFEIGSTVIAGQAQWGSDLVQKNYAQSLLSPGDPLAFERVPNRQLVFPYIDRNASGLSHLFARALNMAIKPGNVIDVIPEDSQNNTSGSPSGAYRRFDIVDGRVVYTEDVRYQRAGLARGEIQIQTLPYPRSASFYGLPNLASNLGFPGWQQIANPTAPFMVWQPGDVPAPVFFWYSGDGNSGFGGNTVATGPSGEVARGYAFMAAFVPSMGSYMLIGPNATGVGNAAASIGNSLRAAGSQIHFPITNTGQTNVAAGFFLPGQADCLAGRVRVFAVMANASTGTIPVYAYLSIMSPETTINQAGYAYSNIGFCPPLQATNTGVVASEMRRLCYVDLGEVRLPVDANALNGTVMWQVGCATGASSNATAGIFDSLVFIPVGDPKGWFGVMATAGGGQFLVSASNVTQGNIQNAVPPVNFRQNFVAMLGKVNSLDVTQNYQGRSPYLSPGLNHVVCLPLGIQQNYNRRFTVPSSGAISMILTYPRYLFLQ